MVSIQDLSYVQSMNSFQIVKKFELSCAWYMGGQFPATVFTSFSLSLWSSPGSDGSGQDTVLPLLFSPSCNQIFLSLPYSHSPI